MKREHSHIGTSITVLFYSFSSHSEDGEGEGGKFNRADCFYLFAYAVISCFSMLQLLIGFDGHLMPYNKSIHNHMHAQVGMYACSITDTEMKSTHSHEPQHAFNDRNKFI